MTGAPIGVDVALPGDWLEVSLPALQDPEVVEKVLAERVDEIPVLAEHRTDIAAAIVRAATSAKDLGVAFAAILAAERDGDPVLANVTLTLRSGPPADPAGDHVISIEIGPDGEPSGPPPPEPVVLPVGPAGRLEEVHITTLHDSDAALTTLIVTYLIPVPGTPDLAVLAFGSPTIGHRRWLIATFHAIAETLAFRFEADAV